MNRGAELLARAVNERGDQRKLSKKVGTVPSVISGWLKGDRKPNARFRGVLSGLFAIPWDAWDDEVATPEAPTGTDGE